MAAPAPSTVGERRTRWHRSSFPSSRAANRRRLRRGSVAFRRRSGAREEYHSVTSQESVSQARLTMSRPRGAGRRRESHSDAITFAGKGGARLGRRGSPLVDDPSSVVRVRRTHLTGAADCQYRVGPLSDVNRPEARAGGVGVDRTRRRPKPAVIDAGSTNDAPRRPLQRIAHSRVVYARRVAERISTGRGISSTVSNERTMVLTQVTPICYATP